MKFHRSFVVLLFALWFTACAAPVATPTPDAAAAAPTSAATRSPSATPTERPSPTATPTPAPTSTPTSTLASTKTPAISSTATSTATPTLTTTPTNTPHPTATSIPTEETAPSESLTNTIDAGAATDNPPGCTPYVDCIPTPAPPSQTLANTQNILLLGSDLRPGRGDWRTDTMLLVVVDRENNRVGIISFPRDYWAYVPEVGYRRINQLDFIGDYFGAEGGGFGLLQRTFAYNFGIRLDKYARLHRQGFVEIIDALGGVDVTLPCEFWDYAPLPDGAGIGDILHLPAGPNHLDGETSLKFVTYRYGSSDYSRARRQQIFLSAAREQFVRAGVLSQIPKLWGIFKDYFSTNLSLMDLVGLAQMASGINMQDVHALVLDSQYTKRLYLPSGAYLVTSDGDKVHRAIESLFEAPPIPRPAQEPQQECPPPPSWANVTPGP
ncbi:MAG: LCP family protein [Chloroflexi bacterium]|nr:LCP family protein [Chloroflexota bacterium]